MKKKINKKTIGVTSVISSVALEIATVIMTLPIKYYKEQYEKCKADYGVSKDNKGLDKFLYASMTDIQKEVMKTWKKKLNASKIKSVVLGTTAIVLAVIGVKMQSDVLKEVQDVMNKEKKDIDKVTQKTGILKIVKKETPVEEPAAEVVEAPVEEVVAEEVEAPAEEVVAETVETPVEEAVAETVETPVEKSKAEDIEETNVEETTSEETEEVEEDKIAGENWICEACEHENLWEKKACSYCGALRSDILTKALELW